MNYYEHHLGDYLRATAHLSMLEDGAYRRLLDVYYVKEQPIPAESRDACRLVRAVSKNERDAVEVVLREFFEPVTEGWRHRRCDTEIARFQDKQAKAKRSAEMRWGAMRLQSNGNANASPTAHADDMRTHCEGNALQSPVTRHQTEDRGEGKARKRATPPPNRPDDVDEQTWADWLQLRKGKHAAVTGTVLSEARNEAGKAGLTLERFLAVWCARGSQGLQADWLRPDERKPINGNHAEPDWRREQRERMQQAAPYAVVRSTTAVPKTADVEVANALARIPR